LPYPGRGKKRGGGSFHITGGGKETSPAKGGQTLPYQKLSSNPFGGRKEKGDDPSLLTRKKGLASRVPQAGSRNPDLFQKIGSQSHLHTAGEKGRKRGNFNTP